jgi:hypothetical protein
MLLIEELIEKITERTTNRGLQITVSNKADRSYVTVHYFYLGDLHCYGSLSLRGALEGVLDVTD